MEEKTSSNTDNILDDDATVNFLSNLQNGESESPLDDENKKYGGTTKPGRGDDIPEGEKKKIDEYFKGLSQKFPGLSDFFKKLKSLNNNNLFLIFAKTMSNPNSKSIDLLIKRCIKILNNLGPEQNKSEGAAKEPALNTLGGGGDLDTDAIIRNLRNFYSQHREGFIEVLNQLLDAFKSSDASRGTQSGGDNGSVEGDGHPIEPEHKQNWKPSFDPFDPNKYKKLHKRAIAHASVKLHGFYQSRLRDTKKVYTSVYELLAPLGRTFFKGIDVAKYSKKGRNLLKSISIITQIYTVIRYTLHKQIYITFLLIASAAASGALLKLNVKSLVLAIINTGFSREILFIAPIATMLSQYAAHHILYNYNEIKPISHNDKSYNRHNSLCYFKNNIQLYNILDTKFIRNIYLGSYIVITDQLRENIELYIDETHKKQAILNMMIDIKLAYKLNEEFNYNMQIKNFSDIQKIIDKSVSDIRPSYRKDIYAKIMKKNYEKSYEKLIKELQNILNSYTSLNLDKIIEEAEKRGKNEANKTKIDIFHIRCIRPIDPYRMSKSITSKFEDLKYTYCVFFSAEELYLKIHNMEPGGSMFKMYSDDINYIDKVMPIECLKNRKLCVPDNWLTKNYLSSYIFNTTKYEILLFINDIFKDIHSYKKEDTKFNTYYNEYFNMIKQIYNIFNINIENLNAVINADEELTEYGSYFDQYFLLGPDRLYITIDNKEKDTDPILFNKYFRNKPNKELAYGAIGKKIDKNKDKIEVITVSEKTKSLNVKEINEFILDIMNNLKYLVDDKEPKLLKVKLPKLSLLHSYNDNIIRQYTTDVKKKNIFGFNTSETVESVITRIKNSNGTLTLETLKNFFITPYKTDLFDDIIKIVYNIENLNRDILKDKYKFLKTKLEDDIYKKIKDKLTDNFKDVEAFINEYHKYIMNPHRNKSHVGVPE